MNTNKLKQYIGSRYFKYGALLVIGIFIGWLVFSNGSDKATSADTSVHTHEEHADKNGVKYWTCSMHPQIKMDKPGKCPICGMDLIPVKASNEESENTDPNDIQMSEEAAALANIQTTTVSKQHPVKEIHLYGTVQADERLLQSQVAHVSGRIEKLTVDFTGETVRRGQTLATLYSPELLNAQKELLEALKMEPRQPALIQAAKEKLRLWKLTNAQIAGIEQSGTVSPTMQIKANTNGVVIDKQVNVGDYVNEGSTLFDIADLSRVWVVFDAYEPDLPFLKVGDQLEYTIQAIPGKTFSGKIAFVMPYLDAATRTAKVRVETSNPGLQLKPEMYADAAIKGALKQGGNEIIIPKSAVLWTGKRSVVYTKLPGMEKPTFRFRQITLGPSLGESYVVVAGLKEGEEIVTNGVFSIDASAQLDGKRSMMNEESHQAITHGMAEMADMKDTQETENTKGITGMKEKNSTPHNNESKVMTASMPGMDITDGKTDSSVANKHAMIHVKGNCDTCKTRIEKAAKGVDGVLSADWNVKSKMLHLNFNPAKTSIDAISKAIAKVGHDTELYKADQKTYDALPACCKYRK